MYRASRSLPLVLLVTAGPGLRAEAFLEESHDLVRGWNLIHVAVEPVVKDPQAALADIAWESLWTWLPTESEPRGGRWLVVYKDQPAFLGTLFSFTGPNSYLLLTTGAGTLRLKGAVRPSRQALRGGAFQLYGPSFDRASPPSFASYFSRAGVKEHIGTAFELSGQNYRGVASGDLLRAGAAYWLFPDQFIQAPDPLRLSVGSSGLRFDAQTTVQEIVVDVGALGGSGGGGGIAPRQFGLRALQSVGATANTDWLELQKPDGTFVTLSAGATIDSGPEQSILRVTFRAREQGLGAEGSGDPAAVVELVSLEGKVTVGAELEVPRLTGTWLGEATITEVERPSFHGGGYAPSPAASISLILEVPEVGPSRLLPCVSVESSRDGRKTSYRLEAAVFREAVALSGTVAQDGKSGTLTGTLATPANHPLNPYRHRYHPEHGKGFDYTRSPTLRFGATLPGQDPALAIENPFASVGVLSGVYEEEIAGLAQEPIRVRGPFRLRRLAGGTAAPCATAAQ